MNHAQILSDTAGNPSQVPDKAIYLKKWTESNRIIITVYWQEVDQVKCMSRDEADIPHIVSQLPVMSDISQNTHLIHSVISEFIFSQTTVNSEVARAGSYTLSKDGTSYSNQTRNISINLFPSDEQFSDIQEISDLAKAKKESLLLALQQEKAGHRFIEGWQLQDVEDKGNCFYLAIIKQMESINHSFLETVPAGTSPHDSLRLRIQGRNFTDGEWANAPEIFEVVRQFQAVVAIVDTRRPDLGFRCYYLNAQGEVNETHNPDEIPTERPIFRLAFTGNHYLSTQSHPSLDIGAIRRSFTDPWISFISSSTNAGFWGGQMTRLYEKHHKKSSCVIS